MSHISIGCPGSELVKFEWNTWEAQHRYADSWFLVSYVAPLLVAVAALVVSITRLIIKLLALAIGCAWIGDPTDNIAIAGQGFWKERWTPLGWRADINLRLRWYLRLIIGIIICGGIILAHRFLPPSSLNIGSALILITSFVNALVMMITSFSNLISLGELKNIKSALW